MATSGNPQTRIHGARICPPTAAAANGISAPGQGHARVATLNGRQLQMWDWKTGQHLCSFRSHHQQQIVASLSSDNQYILTGSETLRIFDAAEKSALHGQTLLRIPQRDSHSAPVSSVSSALSPETTASHLPITPEKFESGTGIAKICRHHPCEFFPSGSKPSRPGLSPN